MCKHSLYHIQVRTTDFQTASDVSALLYASCAGFGKQSTYTQAYPHHTVSGIMCHSSRADLRDIVRRNIDSITQYSLERI